MKAANSRYIDVCDQLAIRLPKMLDQKLLTLSWRSFSEWGGKCVTFSFAYKGTLDLMYKCLHPIATPITQAARLKIIDSPLNLLFRMGQRAVLTCFDYKGTQYIKKGQRYTNVNILWLAIRYLNETINRNTRILEPEIGTDGYSQTRQNPGVDGYGSGFGLPVCSQSGYWTSSEPNQIVLAVRTWTAGGLPGPGPVANTNPGWNPQHRPWIMPDATPKIVNALFVHCWHSVETHFSVSRHWYLLYWL
jgi:hypothetical protein